LLHLLFDIAPLIVIVKVTADADADCHDQKDGHKLLQK
jgi:hypothetical protein